MPFDERSFDNPFLKEKPISFSSKAEVFPPNFAKKVEDFLFDKVQIILEQLRDGNISSKDVSVYTGLSGIALMLMKLQNSGILKNRLSENLHDVAFKITKHNDSRKSSACTFLCGDPGSTFVKVLAADEVKKGQRGDLKRVIDAGEVLTRQGGKIYDEYLYGRAGYLGCLVFMGKHFPDFKDEALMDQICKVMIESGISGAKHNRLKQPMYYEWHESEYVGGAHGYAGIFYYLLKLKHLPSVQQVLQKELRDALYWFVSLQRSSGNYPSSIGSQSDKLVHWCHGAPSAVFTLIEAYKVYGDEKFKEAAINCGECVWKRGFLKKGFGICHGTAGNAYTFIALYQLTRDLIHLYRAVCFAQLCVDMDRVEHRTADRPYSLFEGVAGTMYFLIDMMDVENATFPCYQFH